MANLYDQNDEYGVFKLTKNAVVPDAIAPLASVIVQEWLTEGAGILRWCDAILKEAPDALGHRLIQLGKFSLGAFVELNRPHRRDRGF